MIFNPGNPENPGSASSFFKIALSSLGLCSGSFFFLHSLLAFLSVSVYRKKNCHDRI
jgi:hypothetical protein